MSELGGIIGEQFEHPAGPNCPICKDVERAAAAVEAMGYRKPRTITTREELEALPQGSIVLDATGDVTRLRGGSWYTYETEPMTHTRMSRYLPATVLHEPTP